MCSIGQTLRTVPPSVIGNYMFLRFSLTVRDPTLSLWTSIRFLADSIPVIRGEQVAFQYLIESIESYM